MANTYKTSLSLEHNWDLTDPLTATRNTSKLSRWNAFLLMMKAIISGQTRGGCVAHIGTAAATGTVTYSSATGTLTTTIGGVAITAAAGASDALSATAMAAAITASTNALVQFVVTAAAAGAVVTITAVWKGKTGNHITLAAAATGGTATASGARLAGGTSTSNSF